MALVYLAVHEGLHREVAIKVMSKHLDEDAGFGERFMREARIVANLNHQNIVTVYDVNSYDGYHYIAMEYLPGGITLDHKIKQGITPEAGITTIQHVATALGYAHDKGIIHRDVKPENIMYRENGSAVLTDFGIARSTSSSATKMTATGTIIGTPHYMSPEQAQGEELGPGADIYSLGVVFYEVLTGEVPFDADSSIAILLKHVSEPVPTLDAELAVYQPVLEGMLAKDTVSRYQDCADIVADLDSLVSGGAVSKKTLIRNATAINPATPAAIAAIKKAEGKTGSQATPAKKKLLIPALAATVLVVASAAGYIFYDQNQAEQEQQKLAQVKQQQEQKLLEEKQQLAAKLAAEKEEKLKAEKLKAEKIKAQQLATQDKAAEQKQAEASRLAEQEILLEQATELIAAGNYYDENGNGAFGAYQKILAIDPDQPAAIKGIENVRNHFLQQADKYMQESKPVEAGASLKIVKAIAPTHPGLKDAQGRLSDHLKRKQIESRLDEAQASLERGRAYRPESDNALAQFRSVMQLDPDNVTARLGLARVADIVIGDARTALENNETRHAESLVELAASIDPDRGAIRDIRQQIGNINKLATMVAAADRAYARARYTTPSNDNAFNLYNQILDIEPSNRHAQKLLNNIAEYYAGRVRRYNQSGDLAKANANISVLEKYFPSYPALAALKQEINPTEPPKPKATTPSSLLPVGVGQQQDDNRVVQDIVGLFLNAFQKRDINRLSNVAQLTRRQKILYTQIFKTYKAITINLVPNTLSLDRNDGVATARFEITELTDNSGDAVLAGAGWGKLKVRISRQNGDWLKAEVE